MFIFQVSENINLPLVKKNLSVVLPKMITLSAQPDALTNDQNKSNVPVPEACEVIKFKVIILLFIYKNLQLQNDSVLK